ncbi:succinate dehydrogenase, hydrophobic membrane anchor protein [Aliidiomarina quisquiliarum]|uniref:succinate dehydrogenase, hydrophobic membrane anchor protein n=1 Tax=Aliidiomarina quisquiliarum TaxID=2938947 RepID=UPI00208EACA4|nr:succinate dehydrogenase, hydrophobic membrane anchor protein [Aliidiomarina quisquiliarum]MCO4320939.1 succinate dehydrogenase, hydrophobic membrane anchor protein [Aliidiomarina quisquiliarum]
MVNVASTFGRSGTHDFVLLRATALVMAAYAFFLVIWLACNPSVDYNAWSGLYSNLAMKIFTLLTLTSVLVHGWIGIWQVLTDYIKCSRLRGLIQYVVVLALGVYWFTGLFVLWGV